MLLSTIWKKYRLKILSLYPLYIVQELCYLFIPGAVGMLIDSFITDKGWGVLAFSIAYIGWQGSCVWSKILDTNIYTVIYNDIVFQTIEDHKEKDIHSSKINARIELLKGVVYFFENDVPYLLNSLINMTGSALLLALYNIKLAVMCVSLLIPAIIINYIFAKKMLKSATKINNEYEKQVDIIEVKDMDIIKKYFHNIGIINIQKSNYEAYNVGFIQIFVFLMIIISIYIICKTPDFSYGTIVSTYGYILRFAYSFDYIPHLTERIIQMRDIQKRLTNIY